METPAAAAMSRHMPTHHNTASHRLVASPMTGTCVKVGEREGLAGGKGGGGGREGRERGWGRGWVGGGGGEGRVGRGGRSWRKWGMREGQEKGGGWERGWERGRQAGRGQLMTGYGVSGEGDAGGATPDFFVVPQSSVHKELRWGTHDLSLWVMASVMVQSLNCWGEFKALPRVKIVLMLLLTVQFVKSWVPIVLKAC